MWGNSGGKVVVIGKSCPVSMIGMVGAEIEIKAGRLTTQIGRLAELKSKELVSVGPWRLNRDTTRAKIQ